jgi:hypothetical protein
MAFARSGIGKKGASVNQPAKGKTAALASGIVANPGAKNEQLVF